jgi:hypothetical protein
MNSLASRGGAENTGGAEKGILKSLRASVFLRDSA